MSTPNNNILREYAATANNPEYKGNWEIIDSKFPELKDYDKQVLREYAATANNPEYKGDWNIVDSKFPELFGSNNKPLTDMDKMRLGSFPVQAPTLNLEDKPAGQFYKPLPRQTSLYNPRLRENDMTGLTEEKTADARPALQKEFIAPTGEGIKQGHGAKAEASAQSSEYLANPQEQAQAQWELLNSTPQKYGTPRKDQFGNISWDLTADDQEYMNSLFDQLPERQQVEEWKKNPEKWNDRPFIQQFRTVADSQKSIFGDNWLGDVSLAAGNVVERLNAGLAGVFAGSSELMHQWVEKPLYSWMAEPNSRMIWGNIADYFAADQEYSHSAGGTHNTVDDNGQIRQKDFTDYYKEGDILGMLGDLTLGGIESAPNSLAVAGTTALGMPQVGGAIVFANVAGNKKRELDKYNPELSELQKTAISAGYGVVERYSEMLGDIPLGKMLAKIYKVGGSEAASHVIRNSVESIINQTAKNLKNASFLVKAPLTEYAEGIASNVGGDLIDAAAGLKDFDIRKTISDAATNSVYDLFAGGGFGLVGAPGLIRNAKVASKLQALKSEYDAANSNMQAAFADSEFEFDGERILTLPIEQQKQILASALQAENLTPEQKTAIQQYMQVGNSLNAALVNVGLTNIELLRKKSNAVKQIENQTNEKTGTVDKITIQGTADTENYTLKSGTIALDSEGKVNPQESDEAIYYYTGNTNEDGTPEVNIITPESISALQSSDPKQLLQQSFMEIEAEEFTRSEFGEGMQVQLNTNVGKVPGTVTAVTPTGLVVNAQGQEMEIPFVQAAQDVEPLEDNGQQPQAGEQTPTYAPGTTLEVNGQTFVVGEQDEAGNYLINDENGQPLDRFTPEEMAEFGFSSAAVRPTQAEQISTTYNGQQAAEETAPAQPQYPINAKTGKVDFSQFTPEHHYQYAVETEGEAVAQQDLRNAIKDQFNIITKHKKKIDSANFEKKAPLRAQLKPMQEKLDVLNALAEKYIPQTQPKPVVKRTTAEGTASATIQERWENAPKTVGFDDTLTLPNGEIINGRWVLSTAFAPTPSHNPETYQSSEGFPTTPEGKNVNDNDYTNKRAEVETKAANYDSRAIDDPIVVKDGVVVSGNNRTMSGQIAAKNGTDTKYIDALKLKAKKYGFTQEQIESVENPRIYFEVIDQLPLNVDTFAKFNARTSKSKSATEKAIVATKRNDAELTGKIMATIEGFDSLADFYTSEKAQTEVLKYLLESGVINQNEVPELFENNNFTTNGRNYLEAVIIGNVMQEEQIKVLNMDGMKQYRAKIVRAIVPLLQNSKLAESMISELNTAILYLYESGGNLMDYFSQQNMFAENNFDKDAVLLSIALQRTETNFKKFVADTNNALKDQTIDIFLGRTKTKDDVYEQFRETLNDTERATISNAERNGQPATNPRSAENSSNAAKPDTGGTTANGSDIREKLTPAQLDTQAIDAEIAAQDHNNNPTEKQKETGIYNKARISLQGHNITLETLKGQQRSGTDSNGKAWAITMNNHYGELDGTTGYDGDAIDVFIGPNPKQGQIFVVDQVTPEGTFDESKVMLGFDSAEEAKAEYMSNYEAGWQGFGSITPAGDNFKQWLYDGKKQRKPYAEYKETPEAVEVADQSVEVNEMIEKPAEARTNEEVKPKGITVINEEDNGKTLVYGTKTNQTRLSVKGYTADEVKEELVLEQKKQSNSTTSLKSNEDLLTKTPIGEQYEAIKRAISDDKKIIESTKVTIPWLEQKLKEVSTEPLENVQDKKGQKGTKEDSSVLSPQYKNGDTVYYQGKQYVINGIYNGVLAYDLETADGKLAFEEVEESELSTQAPAPRSILDVAVEQVKKNEEKAAQQPKEVDVAGVFNSLNKKGTAKLSEHTVPDKVSAAQAEADAALQDFLDAFNDLNSDNLGIVDNTAEKQAKMLVAGTKMVGAFTKLGVYKFAELVQQLQAKGIQITEDLLSAIKKAYGAFAAESDIDELDDMKTVRQFTINDLQQKKNEDLTPKTDNLPKNDVSLTDQKFFKEHIIFGTIPKTNDNGQPRSTEIIESETTAIATASAAITNSASNVGSDKQRAGEVKEQATEQIKSVESLLAEVDNKLANLRLTDKSYSTDGIYADYPINVLAKGGIKKDLTKYIKAVAEITGLAHDTDKKGKTEIVNVNIAPAGGDATFFLWSKTNPEHGVYVSIPYDPDMNSGGWYDNYKVLENGWRATILWRVVNKAKKYDGSNQYMPTNVTAQEMAETLLKGINAELRSKGLAEEQVQDTKQNTGLKITKTTNDNGNSKQRVLQGSNKRLSGGHQPDLFSGIDDGGTGGSVGKQSNTISGTNEEQQQPTGRGGSLLPGNVGLSDTSGRGRIGSREGVGTNAQGTERTGGTGVLDTPALVPFNAEDNDTQSFNQSRKYDDNIAAIETLITLVKENRKATPDEKAILSNYVGFGGLKDIVLNPESAEGWKESNLKYRAQVKRINELADEFDKVTGTSGSLSSIKGSILNAHFTSSSIIRSVYDGVQKLGFKGGRMLEPSAGIGNFITYAPERIKANSSITAVELDNLTGNILKYLHDDVNVKVSGIQDAQIPNNSQDLVISNVPFGNYKIFDKAFKGEKAEFQNRIHNYFFAKAIDMAREGGIIAFVTSKGVMDAAGNESLRKYLNDNAEFLGAVRLPNNAFKNNANTEVVTDIIFLKKNTTGTKNNPDFVSTKQVEATHKDGEKQNVTVNNYFVENPQNMLGNIVAGGLYSREDYTVENKTGYDLSKAIKNALPAGVYEKVNSKIGMQANDSQQTIDAIKEGNIEVTGGRVVRKEEGQLIDISINEPQSKIEHYIRLRNALMNLIYSEYLGKPDSELNAIREQLNTEYDTFVKKYGKLSKNAVKIAKQDADGFNVLSLEVADKKDGKADIFRQRTIQPIQNKLTADSVDEAIVISLYENAGIDVERIAELLNITVPEVLQQAKGKIFEQPEGGFVTREEYLSGNVKAKLRQAQEAVDKGFSEFAYNVEQLMEVIPADIPAMHIEARLGSRWIPQEVYSEFAQHLFNTPSAKVIYQKSIDAYSNNGRIETVEAHSKWGTARRNGSDILLDALHINPPKIFDTIKEFGQEKRVLNTDETKKAVDKYEEIRTEFENWVYKSEERRTLLARIYNEKYNTTVKRTYNGDHLNIAGINGVTLRRHQKDAIWMLLQNNGGIIDHLVGAGKTFVMVAGTMEMKRTGIAKKPMIIALKSTIPQIVESYRKAYPMAKVLAPLEKDFTKDNRRKLFSQIANNEWDVIIMSHENYGKIPHEADIQRDFLRAEMQEIEDERAELEQQGEKQALKGLEIRLKNLEARLEKISDIDKDNTLTFEQMGIDHIMVDESQQFKNLSYVTKQRGVAGLSKAEGSKRAFNLFIGIRYLQQKYGADKGTTFLSGTPISNSMVEMYLLLKYLRPGKMAELGFNSFDAWATTFASPNSDIEFTVTGDFKSKTRFREFINVPELSMLYTEIADIRTDANTPLDKPKMKGGGYSVVEIKMSDDQIEYGQRLMEFARTKDGSHIGMTLSKNQETAAMLLATNLSSKMAIDMRLIDSSYDYDPNGKIAKLVDNVERIYNETAEHKGTQLIFSDLGTPKNKTNKTAGLRDYMEDEMGVNLDTLNEIFGNPDEAGYKYPSIGVIREKLSGILELSDAEIDNIISESEQSEGAFNVYGEVRKRLVEKGIPEEQVVFIHDYNSQRAKEKLFKQVQNGEIRIVLGSTQKLGTGVNVQDRVVAVHHLDVPWTPASMEQRNGRALRQGNWVAKNHYGNELPIYAYATERTLDAYKYQLLQTKQRFLDQVKSGDVEERTIRESDGDSESGVGYAELVAMLSGNTDILLKAKLEQQVQKLTKSKRNFLSEVYEAQDKKQKLEERIPVIESNIAKTTENIETITNAVKYDAEGKMEVSDINGEKLVVKNDKGKVVPTERIDYGKRAVEIAKAKLDGASFGNIVKLFSQNGFDFYGSKRNEFVTNNGKTVPTEKRYITLRANNGVEYNVSYSETPGVLLNNIQKTIQGIPAILTTQQSILDKANKDIVAYNEIISKGTEWEKEAELTKALNELKEVTKRLDDISTKDQPKPASNGAPVTDDKIRIGDLTFTIGKESFVTMAEAKNKAGEDVAVVRINTQLSNEDYTRRVKPIIARYFGEWNSSNKVIMFNNIKQAENFKITIENEFKKENTEYEAPQLHTGTTMQPATTDEVADTVEQLLKTGLAKEVRMVTPEEIAGILEGNEQLHTVYHGSPHAFDKFSLEHIGTGEGAQAYGWGLYFTDKKDIAKSYAKSNIDIDTLRYILEEPVLFYNGNKEKIIKQLNKDIEELGWDENTQKALDLVKSSNLNKITLKELFGRNLYTVKIHGDKTIDELNFLRWDKTPTNEQWNQIFKEGEKSIEDWPLHKNFIENYKHSEFKNGENVYNYLRKYTPKNIFERDGSKDASKFLLRAGIDGIQYPANYTTGKANETDFNYVVFDPSAITIKEKVQFMRTPSGTIYGFVKGGVVYLNSSTPNLNTPIHEFGHLWVDAIEGSDLYNRGAELVKNTPYWERVNADPNYKDLSEAARTKEAMAMAIGDKGEAVKRNIGLFARIKVWIADVWTRIGAQFGIQNLTTEQIQNLTFNDFVDVAVSELMSGENLAEKNNLEENALSLQEPTKVEKSNENYQEYKTQSGEVIPYVSERQLELSPIAVAPNSNVQQQANTTTSEYNSIDDTSDDVTHFERLMSEQKHIKLSGSTKIKSSSDVAYLFRSLESSPVENVFAVLRNDSGTYKVLYLSSGATNQSVVDIKLIAAAVKEFGATSVTLVHNHPSGSLQTSNADKSIQKQLRASLNGNAIVLPGVIINLDSGKYLEFDTDFESVENRPEQSRTGKETNAKVYAFDRQKLYTKSENLSKIRSSKDVAIALSKFKRGTTEKYIVLILDGQNRIVRTFLTDDITSKNLIPIVGKHGQALAIGSNTSIQKDKLQNIKSDLEQARIQLLDYVKVGQDPSITTAYTSYADEGYLYEPKPEYTGGDLGEYAFQVVEYNEQQAENATRTSKMQRLQEIMVAKSALAARHRNKEVSNQEYAKQMLALHEEKQRVMKGLPDPTPEDDGPDDTDPKPTRTPGQSITEYATAVADWNYRQTIARALAKTASSVTGGLPPVDDDTDINGDMLRLELDQRLGGWFGRLAEGWQDNIRSVRIFQDMLKEKGTRVSDYNNFYMQYTALQGKNDAHLKDFGKRFMEAINANVLNIQKYTNYEYRDLENYVFLKHGIERNEYMREAAKAAAEAEGKKFRERDDYSGIYAIAAELWAKKNGIAFNPKKKGEVARIQKMDEFKADRDAVISEYIAQFEKTISETIIPGHAKGEQLTIAGFWAAINAATNYSLDRLVSSGIENKAEVDDLKARYQYYVPLRGHEVEAEKVWQYEAPDNKNVASKAIMQASGRGSRAEHPFAYIIQMAQTSINKANRNQLNQTMLRLARMDKSGLMSVSEAWYVLTGTDPDTGKEIWTETEPEFSEDHEIRVGEIRAWNEKMTKLEEEGKAKRFKKGLRIGGLFIKPKQRRQHAISVYEDGVLYQVYINGNPRVSQAINELNGTKWNIPIITQTTRFISSMITSRSPQFMLTNGARDLAFASSILPSKEGARYTGQFLKNYPVAMAILANDATFDFGNDKAKYKKYLKEFEMNGGETGYSHLLELQDIQKDLYKKQKGKNYLNPLTGLDAIISVVDAGNKVIENSTRLATYITSRESGRSIERSVSDSKEVTLNFNRRGSGIMGAAHVQSLFMFVNAGVQALANFGHVYKMHPVRMSATIGAYAAVGFIMPMIINAIGGDDDEKEYMNMTDWERQTNLCLPTGGGFAKIPLPQEMRVFFKLGDEVYKLYSGRTEASETAMATLLSAADMIPISPLGTIAAGEVNDFGDLQRAISPDALRGVAELATNTNFMGGQIYDKYKAEKEGLPGYQKARLNRVGDPRAPENIVAFTKWLDHLTGGNGVEKGRISWNPDIVNHIAKSYLNGVYGIISEGGKSFTKRFYTSNADIEEKNTTVKDYYKRIRDAEEVIRQEKGYYEQLEKGEISEEAYNRAIPASAIEKAYTIRDYENEITKIERILKTGELTADDELYYKHMSDSLKQEVIRIK